VKKNRQLVYLFLSWLVFVVSLATWWMVFSLGLLEKMSAQAPQADFHPQKLMLITEGSVLILLLFFGGASLIYYALREQKRFSEIQLFFSTFSHDLKTAIARLVLQGERLSQKYPEAQEFQDNLLILEMQLENSLHLAQMDQRGLVKEPLDLKKIVARLHTQWPGLKIQLQGKEPILADQAALESILKNLISNSLLHGQADEIYLQVRSDEPSTLIVDYKDNSEKAFEGAPESLGMAFRPSQKGSGIGLYIVRRWMQALNGDISFVKGPKQTLQVALKFPRGGGR
jgi:signal transduction histidine kinase